ncbi:hypothetical protein [Rhodococcus sp. I2R]|uniref:hypothetical protein n=1 Tax=Rhodococcus sp. I2R TaxID=2855445 RepID=UPI001E3CF1E8|nr:hypothetical protein [Rhodococcus sp. I2R]MCC8927231.1 hypothetical protein [Rhodococcus sp. I2R]
MIANGRPDTLARVETDTLELETWQTQFAGRRIDGDTPEAALAWCIETFDDMHAALGLADADNA